MKLYFVIQYYCMVTRQPPLLESSLLVVFQYLPAHISTKTYLLYIKNVPQKNPYCHTSLKTRWRSQNIRTEKKPLFYQHTFRKYINLLWLALKSEVKAKRNESKNKKKARIKQTKFKSHLTEFLWAAIKFSIFAYRTRNY